MKKRVIITGGNGFLGSNLIRMLLQHDFEVIAIIRSNSNLSRIRELLSRLTLYNTDEANFSDLINNHKPNIIMHCATNYGTNIVSMMELIEANLIWPLRLLEAIPYGMKTVFINTDTVLDRRISTYSLSKKQFLEWLKLYAKYFPCVNIELEHFYGPNDNKSKFVTGRIVELIEGKDEINLTPGEQLRDFIYIDDVVKAFEKILFSVINIESGFHPFQVGTGSSISIKNFMFLLKKLTRNKITKLNFGALSYRPDEIMNYQLNLTPLQKLGWKPEYNLEEGLKRTITTEQNTIAKDLRS